MATKIDVTTGYADVNDGRLYFETAGEGDSIVFVHAGIADRRMWDAQFAAFAQDHLAVRYDMRGYGESSVPTGEYSHARDLYALLSLLGIERTILVGCSMGGEFSMDFAASYPHMVKGLVMVCSMPPGLPLDESLYSEPPQAAEAMKAIRSGDFEQASELEVQVFVDGLGQTPDRVDPSVRQLVHEMNVIALQNQVAAGNARNVLLNPALGEDLASFAVPTLAVVGELDEEVTNTVADIMVERMPSAQKVVISNAAHLPNMEHPDEFNAAVRDWLATLEE